MIPFAPLGLSFGPPSTAARNFDFTDRDFMLLVLTGLSSINAAAGGAAGTGLTGTPVSVPVLTTAGGTILLAAGTTGKRCTIFNHGSNPVTISDGGVPS